MYWLLIYQPVPGGLRDCVDVQFVFIHGQIPLVECRSIVDNHVALAADVFPAVSGGMPTLHAVCQVVAILAGALCVVGSSHARSP